MAQTGNGSAAAGDSGADRLPDSPRPPRQGTAAVVGVLSVVVIAVSAWWAVTPGSPDGQVVVLVWFNHPPQPLALVLAVVNPVLRPRPLLLFAIVVLGWALISATGVRQRLEIVRGAVVAVAVAEAMTQVLKRLADQSRPIVVFPALDTHGYPARPLGQAYPSAHTAVVVAVVCALWPWLGRPQRAVGVLTAVLVPLDRIYIGAHWPVDVVGGAAIGLFAGACCWLIAIRWPIPERGGTDGPHPGGGVTLG